MSMKKPIADLQSGRATQIKEVAKRAGVSPATVSRVTNGRATVDEKLATRVWAAINELNYVPNPQGRSLRSGRSRTLGLLVSEITNPFFPELIQSFEDVAAEHGFEVMVGSTNHNVEFARLLITRLAQRRVEGVAVMTFRDELHLLKSLIAAHIPLVTIDVPIDAPVSAVLKIDYRHGINQAVQHLAALGHRRIAFASGPMPHLTNRLRKDAFLESLRTIGVQVNEDWLYEGPHTLEGGMSAARKFLSVAERPTAIVCSNDMMAVGVLRVLALNKIPVPGAFSVIGFDDIHLAEFVTPPLTTVRMSRKAIAVEAFSALMGLRDRERPATHETIRLETSLVVRESTGFLDSAVDDLRLNSNGTQPQIAGAPPANGRKKRSSRG